MHKYTVAMLFSGFVLSVQGQDDLIKREKRRWDRDQLESKLKEPLSTLSDKERQTVEIMVNNLLFPVTQPEYQRNITGQGIRRMERVVQDANRWISKVYDASSQNTGIKNEFAKQTLTLIKSIMTNKNQPLIAQVNAGMILAHFAGESSDPATVDLLLQLIENPNENMGVKLYAFRGLRNLLAQKKPPVKDNAQLEKIAGTLITFIEQKPKLGSQPTNQEIEGVRYLRREAVRALAQIHEPALSDKVRPAFTLFKVMTGMEITPAPRLDEAVEAGLGLLHMKPGAGSKFQPDYAIYFIAGGLRNFSINFNRERSLRRRRFPYRTLAVELKNGFDTFVKTFGKTNPIIAGATQQSQAVLDRVINNTATAPTGLTNWLGANRPTATSLFAGDPATAYKQPGQ